MGNYPNVKYGDASAGAGGGGGGAAGTLPFDPAERGAAVGIVTKDVVPKQQDPGPPTPFGVSPFECLSTIPQTVTFEIEPGPEPPQEFLTETITHLIVVRSGVFPGDPGNPPPGGESVWVPYDSPTDISFTPGPVDPCPDVGALTVEVWAFYDGGSSYSISDSVQFLITDYTGFCAGP